MIECKCAVAKPESCSSSHPLLFLWSPAQIISLAMDNVTIDLTQQTTREIDSNLGHLLHKDAFGAKNLVFHDWVNVEAFASNWKTKYETLERNLRTKHLWVEFSIFSLQSNNSAVENRLFHTIDININYWQLLFYVLHCRTFKLL